MALYIRLQLFRVKLLKGMLRWLILDLPRFRQPLFPLLDRTDRYLKYFVRLFQRMPCLPVFYYPFPVYLWILHLFIIALSKLIDYISVTTILAGCSASWVS